MDDMESMTVGMCLDYIDEYFDSLDPKKKKMNKRKANQSDFDSF